jgi:hypothetical protein
MLRPSLQPVADNVVEPPGTTLRVVEFAHGRNFRPVNQLIGESISIRTRVTSKNINHLESFSSFDGEKTHGIGALSGTILK